MDISEISNIQNQITDFISRHAPTNGVILGVSGGIDSALVLALCVTALGKERTTALFMPEDEADIGETIKQYVQQLGIEHEIIPIKPIFDVYLRDGGINNERLVTGNLKARIRMSLLYSRSNAKGLVVMGTGNRSEMLTGYFTKYGDGGVDYLPIAALYKTQVRELAKHMGVPEEIIAQPPTAGLWSGQTDEEELGITYEKLDLVLREHADKGVPFKKINLPGITKDEIEAVRKRVENYSFKLSAPSICHLKQ
ncbi:MAG: NAD+ synthase [Candidatus Saccharimonadales bacterium]